MIPPLILTTPLILQLGALGDGEGGGALGPIATRAELYRRQASAERIHPSASPNAGRSKSHHDRGCACDHRHIANAVSTRPDRASRKETTAQKNVRLLTVPRHIACELIHTQWQLNRVT